MTDILRHLDKFNTIENSSINQNADFSLVKKFEKIIFFEPSPDYRKFKILDSIYKNAKISQKLLSDECSVVPAMINKYLHDFRKNQIIFIGKKLREKYLFDYISEILILYKNIKDEIKIKMDKILRQGREKKIALFGANEITELILQINSNKQLNICGIIDSDSMKEGLEMNGIKIQLADFDIIMKFDIIIITSLSHFQNIYDNIKDIENYDRKVFIFAEI